jgi:Pyruvate/2-oxoacid:ferredoxin oxidoreductase delta subunit
VQSSKAYEIIMACPGCEICEFDCPVEAIRMVSP